MRLSPFLAKLFLRGGWRNNGRRHLVATRMLRTQISWVRPYGSYGCPYQDSCGALVTEQTSTQWKPTKCTDRSERGRIELFKNSLIFSIPISINWIQIIFIVAAWALAEAIVLATSSLTARVAAISSKKSLIIWRTFLFDLYPSSLFLLNIFEALISHIASTVSAYFEFE